MKHRNRGKYQDKKRWLRRYSEHVHEIEREIESEMYWRERALSLSTRPIGLISGNGTGGGMEACVVKYLEIADHCKELADKADKAKDEIYQAINELQDQDHREILKMRYIDGLDFDEMSEKLDYSLGWLYHLHGDALKKLEIKHDN